MNTDTYTCTKPTAEKRIVISEENINENFYNGSIIIGNSIVTAVSNGKVYMRRIMDKKYDKTEMTLSKKQEVVEIKKLQGATNTMRFTLLVDHY